MDLEEKKGPLFQDSLLPVAQHESESKEKSKGPLSRRSKRYSQEEISVREIPCIKTLLLGRQMITYSDKVFERTTLLFTNPKENNKPVVAEICLLNLSLNHNQAENMLYNMHGLV